MAENLLEVKDLIINLKKKDRNLKAVNGISFEIEKGEIVGLAGESGCGKSLVALSIMGLLPQNTRIRGGMIKYKNTLLASVNEKENRFLPQSFPPNIRGKEISMIFQEYRQSLNPLIKVGSQITETLELTSRNNRLINIDLVLEMLRRLGFDEPKKTYNAYPHQLSGGMCQRIIAAIAAIGQPRLLLADEPSTALDAKSQQRLLSMLMEMNCNNSVSILFISHDLSIIKQFTNRYLVMYAGKIVEEGPSHALFTPLHPYTKALAGAIPCKEKKGNYLETIPGKVPSVEDRLTGCPFAVRCKKTKNICYESFPPAIEAGNRRVYCYFPETGGADA